MHTFKRELFELVSICTANVSLCDKISVDGTDSVHRLVERAIVRLRGRRLTPLKDTIIQPQSVSRGDAVSHMIWILHKMTIARHAAMREGKDGTSPCSYFTDDDATSLPIQ